MARANSFAGHPRRPAQMGRRGCQTRPGRAAAGVRDVTLLPQKKLKNYLKTPTSKPISSVVPSEHNKEEFMKKVNAAFVEAIKAA